jgi:hypothetical protein
MIDSAAMRQVGIRLALIAAVLAALLAGCGGNEGGESARDVAQSYVDAQTNKDFDEVCSLLSDQFRQQLGSDNCPRFLEEQSSGIPRREFKLVSVNEDGNRATATVETGGETGKPVRLRISLERQDGDWRVTGVGGGAGD